MLCSLFFVVQVYPDEIRETVSIFIIKLSNHADKKYVLVKKLRA